MDETTWARLEERRRKPTEYTPWVRKGIRLGYIRNGTYYIDDPHRVGGGNGNRKPVSTRCKTAEAAFAEYERWASDPVHYSPQGTVREGAEWKDAVIAFLKSKQTAGRKERYLDDVARELEVWANYPGFQSLDSFNQADIESFLADLVAGKLTGRWVTTLDGSGTPSPTSMIGASNEWTRGQTAQQEAPAPFQDIEEGLAEPVPRGAKVAQRGKGEEHAKR